MGDTFRIKTNGSRVNGVRAAQARTGLIGALDVGSSKIACIIGRAEASGGLRILGSALHESQGIRSGAVTNLELADQSIRKAVDAAEQLADLSEFGRKKYGEAYAKGAEAVEARLANPKLSFVDRSKLEEAKKERDAVIAQTEKLLGGLRQKLAAIEKSGQAPAKKK